MAAVFDNQTVSPLLLFHVDGASERNVIPATKRGDNSQLGNRNSMVHSLRSKSTRNYPSRVIFEEESFALMLS